MQKFDTPAPVSAILDIPAGYIRFIATDRADTTVEVLPADASKGRDVKAAAQITVEYGDGVLRIGSPEAKSRILGNSGSVEVTVQLPAGSRVEAKAASAELSGVGPLGDVIFEGAQGAVELDWTENARLTLQDGDVSVGRLAGDGEITTLKGDLTVAEAVHGTVTLRTESGEISIAAAHGVSAALNAGTTYGRIHNSLKNADGADLLIHASTAHGDITARSL
ncbi:DUF4097 family beta strand repeat-containing protein [Streptomyces sp. NBC_01465]|uniref:DUF4097 family beta strand repeat-containing protein n=1 Tax=Streptomyces sp. NBC_01465 TaxID=2903878 RepID=UPI002E35FD42|nr:DUF4097 family beta strand repeat-containing protein [Streptomyces sp. NBC_01465]